MKIQLIDFGGRSPESAHANDAGADVFSPKDAVIRREISVSCLWDLDASPDTGFYFCKLEGAWYGGFWFHWEIRRTSSQRFSLILNGRFCRSYCKL